MGWHPERGISALVSGIGFTSTRGELTYVVTTQNSQITLWGSDRPITLVSDGQAIPIRRPWQIAILWYVLWQVYEQEGDHHNGVLAAYYTRRLNQDTLDRMVARECEQRVRRAEEDCPCR